MKFSKLAYARRVLRAAAEQEMQKTALLAEIGQAGLKVGKGALGAANSLWQKSMKANGAIMGTAGLIGGAAAAYHLGKQAINKTKASYRGFDPSFQGYAAQPQGY